MFEVLIAPGRLLERDAYKNSFDKRGGGRLLELLEKDAN